MVVESKRTRARTSSPLSLPYKRHLACGGRLVYTYVKGGIGYKCKRCEWEHLKRGYDMPFPKDVKHAAEVAKGIPLDQVDGQSFLLESWLETSDPEDDIRSILMHCKDEDGEEVLLGTTSEVVRKQLKALEGKLPVLVTPTRVGRYYTIY